MQRSKDNPFGDPEVSKEPLNDYSSAPEALSRVDGDLSNTLGSATGGDDNAIEAGGWDGTDDATSTAPSDRPSIDAESHLPREITEESLNLEDPTGRAYAGGLDPEDGGVTDLAGRAVGESRNWENDPIDLSER